MTPEGRVKAKVKKALDALNMPVWRFMPVQTGYGAPALDYLLCIKGRFIAIETKAPGKKLTPMQEGTKAAIEAAGGIVLIVWDDDSLAIATRIILALECAPRADDNPPHYERTRTLNVCLNIFDPEEARSTGEHLWEKLTPQAPDAATRGIMAHLERHPNDALSKARVAKINDLLRR